MTYQETWGLTSWACVLVLCLRICFDFFSPGSPGHLLLISVGVRRSYQITEFNGTTGPIYLSIYHRGFINYSNWGYGVGSQRRLGGDRTVGWIEDGERKDGEWRRTEEGGRRISGGGCWVSGCGPWAVKNTRGFVRSVSSVPNRPCQKEKR